MKKHCCCFTLIAFAFAASCLAQTTPTFNILNSPSGPAPLNLFAIDLNGDGISDIVQTDSSSIAAFEVSLGKGDGTFQSPVSYPIAGATAPPLQFTVGDFNGDGKVDLIFTLTGTAQLAFVPGNGDGTFQSPHYISVPLADTYTFGGNLPVLAADFNHDGNQDLVVAGVSPPYPNDPYDQGPQQLYLLEGDGNGGFPTVKEILATSEDVMFDTFALGDFNSDNDSDVALAVKPFPNPYVSGGVWQLYVLFGDGTGGFVTQTVAENNAWTTAPTLSTGDVNGDGRTDLFFVNGATDQLDVYLGQGDMTFTKQSSNMPSLVDLQYDSLTNGTFAVADFNDDGRMDLVSYAPSASPQTSNLLVMTGGDPAGTFTYHVIPLPVFGYGASQAVVGEFNDDAKPDIAVGQYDTNAVGNAPMITTAINSTSGGLWSNCPYPMGARAIALCSPVEYASGEVSFDASASSFGMLRKMELWVDGAKTSEQHHVWEDQGWLSVNAPFAAGTHSATIYTADVDNTLDRLDFTFTVGDDHCAAPRDPGVNICKPWGDSSVTSPVTVQATANLPGTLARMEIWVDGEKKFTQTTGTSLDAEIALKPGTHSFTVYAVNTSGAKWMKTVSAIAQ